MSWNNNNNNNNNKSPYGSGSGTDDDDVKIGIARPSMMETSSEDDDDSYNDRRRRHHGTLRGRRSHLSQHHPTTTTTTTTTTTSSSSHQQDIIVAPSSLPTTSTTSTSPNSPRAPPSLQSATFDEKALYRRASDLIDQQVSTTKSQQLPSSFLSTPRPPTTNMNRSASTPLPSSTTTTTTTSNNNAAAAMDEKEIYRQASDMIDMYVVSNNQDVNAPDSPLPPVIVPERSLTSYTIRPGAVSVIPRSNVTNAAIVQPRPPTTSPKWAHQTPSLSSARSSSSMNTNDRNEYAAARLVVQDSERRPGAFAVHGPGSAHSLHDHLDDDTPSVSLFSMTADDPHLQGGDHSCQDLTESNDSTEHDRDFSESADANNNNNGTARATTTNNNNTTTTAANEKATMANLPGIPPSTRGGRRNSRATLPGAQHVRGIPAGVNITNYLDQMRRENNSNNNGSSNNSSDHMFVASVALTIPESSSLTTAPVHPIQPVTESYRTEANNSSDNKNIRRMWYIIAAVVVCLLVVGVAVGVGVAVTSKDGDNSNNNSSGSNNNTTTNNNNNQTNTNSTPVITLPPTTPMSPFTTNCKALATQAQPNVLSQCKCNKKISIVAKDVAARYDAFSQSLAPMLAAVVVAADTNGGGGGGGDAKATAIESCSPQNQALVWLASGNGISSSNTNNGSPASLQQRYSLALLFLLWNGIYWQSNDGWWTSNDECTWYGIYCQDENHHQVVSIALGGMNITGPLSMETMALLTNLESLDLPDNAIRGSISGNSLSSLSALQNIHLGNTILNGTLPTELGLLAALQTLEISSTRIHGTIPNELFSLGNTIAKLDLSHNALSGTISTNIGQLTQMRYWIVQANNMTGTIPSEFGLCTSLAVLDVSFNQLHGTLPNTLGELTSLAELDFDGNHLSGVVPESVCSFIIPSFCIPTLQCSCGCQCKRH